jgi:hypothetical protein
MAGDTLVIVAAAGKLIAALTRRPTVVFPLKFCAGGHTVAGPASPLLGMRSLDERMLCNPDNRG